MMRHGTFPSARGVVALARASGDAAEEQRPEQVQSDISMREISIQSNFTGVEIVLFGSVDFSHAPSADEGPYDVIMTVRGPDRPIVVRKKERIAGLWMNGPSKTFPAVPGFYAVLASRPFRAVAPEETLQKLGIGFANLDFGKTVDGETADDGFRANLIRLQQEHRLFQESDDAIGFIGRSLFSGSVDLPVNVPIGRYTTQVFLFRDGKLLSQSQSSLQVHKVGFERVVVYARLPLSPGLWAACGADGDERWPSRLRRLPAPVSSVGKQHARLQGIDASAAGQPGLQSLPLEERGEGLVEHVEAAGIGAEGRHHQALAVGGEAFAAEDFALAGDARHRMKVACDLRRAAERGLVAKGHAANGQRPADEPADALGQIGIVIAEDPVPFAALLERR